MQNITLEQFNIVGISIRTTNQNGRAEKEIAALWSKFIGENIMDKIPNRSGAEVYSVYTDYEGDHTEPYTAVLGCKVSSIDNIPDGMTSISINRGNYVKTIARGDLNQGLIVDKWSEIWALDIDRAYTQDFEVFGEKAQNPSDAEVEFYISVKQM